MKKLLATLVTLVMLVGCCFIAAMPASAEEMQINYDDFDIADGMIIEYLGAGGNVIVPSEDAEGNPITRIDNKAFWDNDTVTAVYICEGIEEIGDQAFELCTSLTEVSLPYSLEEMGHSAFQYTSLNSITLPGKLKKVPASVVVSASTEQGGLGILWENCIMSYGIEEVSHTAFYFGGTELVFPSSVHKIEGGAIIQYHKEEINLYICNPDCEIGVLEASLTAHKPNSNQPFAFEGGEAPIMLMWSDGKKGVSKYYIQNDAQGLKDTINGWKATYPDALISIVGKDADAMAQKNQECKDKGIIKATKYVMDADLSADENGGDTNWANGDKNNNNNNANADNNGGNNMMLMVIIICASVVIVVITVAVMMVNMNNGKKKKKKKKKKAASPVIQTETEVATENLEKASTETEENR